MKAILIDPYDCRVSTIEISKKNVLQDLYAHMRCEVVEVGGQIGEHDVIVDEEGLFKREKKFFSIKDTIQPLAGYGVVLLATDDGDWDDCRIMVDDLAEKVRFLSEEQVAEGFAMVDHEREKFFDECKKRDIVVAHDNRPWRNRAMENEPKSDFDI